MTSSKDSQDHYHAKGQHDGSENNYDSPRFNPIYDFFATKAESEKNEADTKAYDAGWENGWKQR